ncbi:MAG: hypothetical protein UR26_C0001G0052 [candidate division TM6 bacterium GW2011_GWF2_32_72]|nr:MAG: hypothetical protein UR26_C0001G0052 [candidate division TM6 bacterium GW2011_GWF2_32_72]
MSFKKGGLFVLTALLFNFISASEKSNNELIIPFHKESPVHFRENDIEFQFKLNQRTEAFLGEWTTYFNTHESSDQIFYIQHTLDAEAYAAYGCERFGSKVLELVGGMRNQAIFGTPDSIAQTTENEINAINMNFGAHYHFLHKHLVWMKEAWLKFSLDHAFKCEHSPIDPAYFIKAGYFSFELGRGISLGDAFAVNSEVLGFFGKTSIVDQFAPGLLISGKCLKDRCTYDFYLSTIDNQDTDLEKTSEKIYSQMYKKRNQINGLYRGPFHIATIAASRLKCKVVDQKVDSGVAELYGLWLYDPEQDVETKADAKSNLYTVGVSGEFHLGKVEFGFDTAKNFGSQFVFALDRNKKSLAENTEYVGAATVVNSHIVLNDDSGKEVLGAPYGVQTSKNRSVQTLVNDCEVGEAFNGKQLGLADETVTIGEDQSYKIYNAEDRFRNSYYNKFSGVMFVSDVCYWVKPEDFFVAAAFGYASGDGDPQIETKDKTFKGFIPVQSVYSGGDKVRSFFVLGGGGSLKRIISIQHKSNEATTISGLTDLMYVGISAKRAPADCEQKWYFNPNVLAYWKTHPLKEYLNCFSIPIDDEDANPCTDRQIELSRFLGIELNIFAGYSIFESIEAFFAGSAFIPGHFFEERKEDLLGDYVLGDDIGFSLNFGFNYHF